MKINNLLIFVRHLYGEMQFKAILYNLLKDRESLKQAVKYCIICVFNVF